MEKDAVQVLDKMLGRNRRFFLLLLAGGVTLAIISLSLQFLNLIPTTPTERQLDGREGAELAKSRKRVFPETHPPGANSAWDAYSYCNTPNRSEQAWEGHSPADYTLLSVQVMIRHGDRYPLYTIPKTKRPSIDCTLSAGRSPSHPLLTSYISHMGLGGRAKWEAPLSSVPRIPNHASCETGELTQTGVVQHLRNGQLLRQAYKHHSVLPSDWSPRQLGFETTSRSRTVQSGLAFLYGFLPDFDWGRVSVRHQWSALFCGSACDCPARNRYLEEEQRRQYRLRVGDGELEKTYADMARTVGVLTRQLRAANPIDSLLCHLCHGLSFPCALAGGGSAGRCLTMEQFAVIRRQQQDDDLDRGRVGLYRKYAILAMYPYLNQTAAKMERASREGARREEVFSLTSGHDVTVSPLLSALGLMEASFPRFAARVVFELWRSPPAPAAQAKSSSQDQRSKGRNRGLFVRILYDGEDVTFHTTFCRSHDRHAGQPLCPLENFLSFVRRDMFSIVNATSYQEACEGR